MEYRYGKVDPNKIKFQSSDEHKGSNLLTKGAQAVGGIGTAFVQGAVGIPGLPGQLQELGEEGIDYLGAFLAPEEWENFKETVSNIPVLSDVYNLPKTINKNIAQPLERAVHKGGEYLFGDIEPENIATKGAQGLARIVGGGLGARAGIGALKGGANAIKGVTQAARGGKIKAIKDIPSHLYNAVKESDILQGGREFVEGVKGLKDVPGSVMQATRDSGKLAGIKRLGREYVNNPALRDVSSLGAADIAYNVTGSPLAAGVAGLGTSYGLGKLSQSKGKQKLNEQTVQAGEDYEQHLRDKLKSEGSKVNLEREPLKVKIKDLFDEVSNMETGHGFPENDRTSALKNLRRSLNKVSGVTENVSDVKVNKQIKSFEDKIRQNDYQLRSRIKSESKKTDRIKESLFNNKEIDKRSLSTKYDNDKSKLEDALKRKIHKNDQIYERNKTKKPDIASAALKDNQFIRKTYGSKINEIDKKYGSSLKDLEKKYNNYVSNVEGVSQKQLDAIEESVNVKNRPYHEKIDTLKSDSVKTEPKDFTVYDLYNIKKDINSVWNVDKSRLNSIQKRRFKDVMQEINKLEESNPELYNYIKTADAITGARNFEGNVSKFLDKIKKPIDELVPNQDAKAGLLALIASVKGWKAALKTVVGNQIMGAARGASEINDIQKRAQGVFNILQKDPQAKSIVNNLIKSVDEYGESVSKASQDRIIKSLVTYNNYIEKEEESKEQEYTYTKVNPRSIKFS